MSNNGQWVVPGLTAVYTKCDSPTCGQYTRWRTHDGKPPADREPQCGCCYKRLPAWDVVRFEDILKGVIICDGK